MDMDEEFLEINDLDWFASCQGGLLAHFATGGRGFVPIEVRRSVSVYEEVCDYFYSIIDSVDVEVVESSLPGFGGGVQRERYLRSFIDVARRGLFSYDVNDEGGYKLIVRPKKPRRYCELPVGVKNILHVLPVSASANIGVDDFL